MSRWYLDTSAALELLVEEAGSEALSHELVTDFLDGVSLYEVPSSLFREAGLLPGANLRSLDALHLAAATRIGVDQVVTYDARMGESARLLGLRVFAPLP